MLKIDTIHCFPRWMSFLVAVAIAMMATCWMFSFASSFVFASGGRPAGGGDFTLRRNEVRCVLDRIDPFAITRREVTGTPYVPYNQWSPGKYPLTGYTPWTYPLMLPFSILPIVVSAAIYTLLELACVFFLFRYSLQHALNSGLGTMHSCMVSASICFLVFPITSAFGAGNFGLPFAATILLMAEALQSNKDAKAGLYWAFLMCKPQIGLLFAIPILLHRRWKTLLCAVGVCLSLSIVVSLWLHIPVHTLLLEIVHDGDVGCYATDCVPLGLFRSLIHHVPKGTVLLLHAAIGFSLCFLCNWRVRTICDWTVRLAPPAFFCTIWTYGWPHDKCVYAIVIIVAMTSYLQIPSSGVWRHGPLLLSFLCGSSILLFNLPGGSTHPLFGHIGRYFGWIPPPGTVRNVFPRETFFAICTALKILLAIILFVHLLPQKQPLGHE